MLSLLLQPAFSAAFNFSPPLGTCAPQRSKMCQVIPSSNDELELDTTSSQDVKCFRDHALDLPAECYRLVAYRPKRKKFSVGALMLQCIVYSVALLCLGYGTHTATDKQGP